MSRVKLSSREKKCINFVMLMIMILLGVLIIDAFCSCTPPKSRHYPTHSVSHYRPMYPACVEDFVYSDGTYVIVYYDESLAEFDSELEYISIECTKDDFFAYLDWYTKMDKYAFDSQDALNNNGFYITEIVTKVEGGNNFRYKLVNSKNNETFNDKRRESK